MRARIENDVLYLHRDDVPQYKKNGSTVRNTYFWTLKSIAGHTPFGGDWEYEAEVWLALRRVLQSYIESGYLGLSETILEFAPGEEIPALLMPVATWGQPEDVEALT